MPSFVDGDSVLVKGTSRRYFNKDTKCYMENGKCKTLQMRSVPDLELTVLKGNPGCVFQESYDNGTVVCPATGEWTMGNVQRVGENFCSVPIDATISDNLGRAYIRDNNIANKNKKAWRPMRCNRNEKFKITEPNMIALCNMRRFLYNYDNEFASDIKRVPLAQQEENDLFRTLHNWKNNDGHGKTTSDSEYQSLHELRLPLKTPQGGFHQEVYDELSDGDMYQYMTCNANDERIPDVTDMSDIANLVMPPFSTLPSDLIAEGYEKIDDLLDNGLWINLPNYMGTNNTGTPATGYNSEYRYNGLVVNGYKGRTHFIKETLLRDDVDPELSSAFMIRFYVNSKTYFTPEAEVALGLENNETLTNDDVFKGLKYFLEELNKNSVFTTNEILNAKVSFYESICKRFTRAEVADASLTSFLRFACSCNLPNSEYIDDQGRNRYREDYTRACDTLCVSSGGAVRSYTRDENNNIAVEKCESSLCVIDNLNITLIDSDVSGGINIEQACAQCVGASCTCLISNTNISAIDSSIEGGINLATVCDRCIESEGRVEDGVEVDCTGTGGGSGELSGDIYQDLSYSNSLYSTAQSVQRYKGTILPVLGALSLIIVLCIVLVIMLSSKSTPYYDLPST